MDPSVFAWSMPSSSTFSRGFSKFCGVSLLRMDLNEALFLLLLVQRRLVDGHELILNLHQRRRAGIRLRGCSPGAP